MRALNARFGGDYRVDGSGRQCLLCGEIDGTPQSKWLAADPGQDGVGAAGDGDDDHCDHGDFQGGGVGEGEDPAAVDDGEDAFDGEAEETTGGDVGQDFFEWDLNGACGGDEECEREWRGHQAADRQSPSGVFAHLRLDVLHGAPAFSCEFFSAFF